MSKSQKQYDPAFKYNRAIADHIVEAQIGASSVDSHVFVADQAYQVVSVSEIHSVGASGATVRPRKITDNSAPGAAASTTVLEITTGTIDLNATANTTQTAPLVATSSTLQLAAGDKLALDFNGTLTGLVGLVCVALRRI